MSGEGAAQFFEQTDDAGGNECRRAPTAYPFLYAEGDSDYSGGVVSFACSGARTAHLVRQAPGPLGGRPQHGSWEPIGGPAMTQYEQLDRLLADNDIDASLILLSIGGNDSGFSTIGMTCVAPGDCDEKAELWLGNLENVRPALADAYEALKVSLEGREIPVVVVAYPDPLSDKRCSEVALSQPEVDFIHRFLTGDDTVAGLNDVVAQEARRAGFRYLGSMQDAFVRDGLQLCGTGEEAGVNFVSAQSMNGSIEAQANPKIGSITVFTRIELGHQAMRDALAAWLDSVRLGTPDYDAEETGVEYLDHYAAVLAH